MAHKRIVALFLYFWIIWSFRTVKCESVLAFKKHIVDFSNSIATDVGTFKELVEKSKVFVDNTLLINEILKKDNTDLELGIHSWLWLGPSKSGKTMNLDMIKTFFELQVDPKGEEYESVEITSNYKLFARGVLQSQNGTKHELESPLCISANKTIMDVHQGKHPVIHVQFKNTEINFEENPKNVSLIKEKIKYVISETFKQHEYMIHVLEEKLKENNDNKTRRDLQRFQDYLHQKDDEIERSVAFLSRILENHFKRRVVILMDDYDTPVLHVMKENSLEMDSIFDLMKLLTFKILDSSDFVFIIIVTGRYKIEAQQFYTTKYITQKDDKTATYFGFSKKIVQTLLEKHQIDNKLCHLVHKWYDGYESSTHHHYYNPLAIAKFLQHKEISVYTTNISYTDYMQSVLYNHPESKNPVLALLSKQAVDYEHESTGDLRYKLYNLLIYLEDEHRVAWGEQPKKCYDRFVWYLLKEGYVTELHTNPSKPWLHSGRLLNSEMGFLLANRLIHVYKHLYNITENLQTAAASKLHDFINSESTTTTELQDSLTNLYQDSSYDVADVKASSSIFYSVVLKLQCNLKFDIDVFYNKTHDMREPEVVIIDHQTRNAAIIDFTNNTSPQDAIKLVGSHFNIFNATYHFVRVKLIGINFTPDKNVQVSASAKLKH